MSPRHGSARTRAPIPVAGEPNGAANGIVRGTARGWWCFAVRAARAWLSGCRGSAEAGGRPMGREARGGRSARRRGRRPIAHPRRAAARWRRPSAGSAERWSSAPRSPAATGLASKMGLSMGRAALREPGRQGGASRLSARASRSEPIQPIDPRARRRRDASTRPGPRPAQRGCTRATRPAQPRSRSQSPIALGSSVSCNPFRPDHVRW
jgi:hypothetical protein